MPNYAGINGLTNISYPGSSGWGTDPSGRYGTLTTTPAQPKDVVDYPVFDIASGKLMGLHSRQPWTGPLPQGWADPRGGGVPTGGVQVPYAAPGTTINPNDPNQRYRPVDITKNADVVAGQQDLMKTFKSAADASLQDFSKYLNSFSSDLGAARTAGAAATNIGPTVGALQSGASRYAAGLTQDQAALQDLLARNAAAEQGIVTQANAILPQYNAAAKAVADQQMRAVQEQLSRYKMGTGTPTSAGTDETRILADAAARVYAPFEQAKIAEQQNILKGLALPVQQDITNRQTMALTQFNPQAQAAIWSSGRATEQDVQALRSQVSTMTYQQALQFMTALGVPAQVQQTILSGQIGQLGNLSAIESGAKYQGLSDVLGTYINQPMGFSMATPAIPNYGPQVTRTGTSGVIGTLGNASNAPITIAPGTIDPSTGGYAYRPIAGAPGGAAPPNAYQRLLAQYGQQGAATGNNPASYLGGGAEGVLVAG